MTWSQPGQRYGLVAAEPVTWRTNQSPSSACSTDADDTPPVAR